MGQDGPAVQGKSAGLIVGRWAVGLAFCVAMRFAGHWAKSQPADTKALLLIGFCICGFLLWHFFRLLSGPKV
jgi:hypothetical protein